MQTSPNPKPPPNLFLAMSLSVMATVTPLTLQPFASEALSIECDENGLMGLLTLAIKCMP